MHTAFDEFALLLLICALAELPRLARGKGNRLIAIPAQRAQEREEYLLAAEVLGAQDGLVIHAGKRHLTLNPADLIHYQGERGRRGLKLPRRSMPAAWTACDRP